MADGGAGVGLLLHLAAILGPKYVPSEGYLLYYISPNLHSDCRVGHFDNDNPVIGARWGIDDSIF